jgi:hypothetical protein
MPALGAAPARALPSCEAAPCPSDRGQPALILSYYRDRDLTKLIVATRRAKLPANTPVYYGGYWGSDVRPDRPPPGPPPPPPPPDDPDDPPRPRPPMPGRRYSPIFTLSRTQFWQKREDLTPEQREIVRRGGGRRFRGRVPLMRNLLAGSGRRRYLWGVELGRRQRDRIRKRRADGQRVVTWQLDELISELRGPGGWRLRQFTQGVLRGLTYGRGELGDVKLPGIVWATGPALELARRRGDPSLGSFWRAVNDSALFLVGEEYPAFRGSARRAARHHARWRSLLYHAGGARRRLSRKYVVGMTPGHRTVPGLGGNVGRRPRPKMLNWRLRYIKARSRTGPAGLAQYNFTFENATWPAIRDVLSALATGLRIVRRV